MAKINHLWAGSPFGFLVEGVIKLSAQNSEKAIFVVAENDGLLRKIEIEGEGLDFKSGELVGGVIDEIRLIGPKKSELISFTDANISAKSFQSALASNSEWDLLSVLFGKNDRISSKADNAEIFSGAGNDTVKSTSYGFVAFFDGPGSDRYIGSKNNGGDNWVHYSQADQFSSFGDFSGIMADLGSGKVIDPWGNTDTLQNISYVVGTSKDDVIRGGDARWESLTGLDGADDLDGGGGVDRVDYKQEWRFGATSGVTINLADGFADDGFGSRDTLRNFEEARGSRFDDVIIGDDADNVIEGDGGVDLLTGGGGADVFRYRDGFGDHTITDFVVGTDKLKVSLSTIFDDFDDVNLSQQGADVLITFNDTDGSITLQNVKVGDLSAADFVF